MEIPEEIKKLIVENYPHNIEICSGFDKEKKCFCSLAFLIIKNKRDKCLLSLLSNNVVAAEIKLHDTCGEIKATFEASLHSTTNECMI